MNIADKSALFAEAARVLRAGARFAIFDLMRTGDGELSYPLPWQAQRTRTRSYPPGSTATRFPQQGSRLFLNVSAATLRSTTLRANEHRRPRRRQHSAYTRSSAQGGLFAT